MWEDWGDYHSFTHHPSAHAVISYDPDDDEFVLIMFSATTSPKLYSNIRDVASAKRRADAEFHCGSWKP